MMIATVNNRNRGVHEWLKIAELLAMPLHSNHKKEKVLEPMLKMGTRMMGRLEKA
jgi:hypothetical protein